MSSPNTSPPKRRGRPPKVKEAPAPASQPQGEMVVPIPLTELYPFPNHPFKVRNDDAMKETTESVKEYGVLTPAIVRPREAGGYEIVAGHRRKRACELAGLTALPALVRNLDDDTATILMVDSNIQQENILPSERAQAYKMKLEAIKRRGERTDLTLPNNSANFRSDDEIGAAMGMSGDTVRNYISLTQLVPELQQMVDDKKIAVTPAYQIAALKPEEQALLVETIESEQATPSVSQAQRMKKLKPARPMMSRSFWRTMGSGRTISWSLVMSELHRMNDSQFRRARKLIRRLCANYDGGNCLPLDDGDPCPCPQLISPTLICKYFRVAVLPADWELCAEVLGGIHSWKRCALCGGRFLAKGNRAVYCGPCAQKERRRKTRDRVRRHRG